MKIGETRFFKYGGSFVVKVPPEVRRDKDFPFKVGEGLMLRIEGKKLVMERD